MLCSCRAHTYGLLEIIQSTYSLLKSDSCKPEEHLNIGNLVSNFLTVTSNKISLIKDVTQESEIEFLLINLSENILWEYMINKACRRQIITLQIEEAIRTTCQQCKYKLEPYEKLLTYTVFCLSPGIDKNGNRIKFKITNAGICHTIHWLDKGKLSELLDILKKMNYIKSTQELYAFFQPSNHGVIVRWNAEKKYHLAYLLHRLFNEKYARIKGNKGYFTCAEMMFIDMDGKPFKKDSLRKISSRICKEKDKYLDVRNEMDGILLKINNGTNGL